MKKSQNLPCLIFYCDAFLVVYGEGLRAILSFLGQQYYLKAFVNKYHTS